MSKIERPVQIDEKPKSVKVELNVNEWPVRVRYDGEKRIEVPYGKIEGLIYLVRHGGFSYFQG